MDFKGLFENFSGQGIVTSLAVRPQRLAPMQKLEQVLAIQQTGLDGDRYKNKGGARQVTLFQHEHLSTVGSFLGKGPIDPELVRRNIIIKGINLLSLKNMQFQIGEAIFAYSGECHPCSRMEQNLGPGGYNAMRGHGGITARIVLGGLIRVGDKVIPLPSK